MPDAQPVSRCHAVASAHHVIRLHGPWQITPLQRAMPAANSSVPPGQDEFLDARTVKLPASWKAIAGADFQGRVRCRRRFGRPTNMEPRERIELVVQSFDGLVRLLLNGTPLDTTFKPEAAYRFDVTGSLCARNVLDIEIERSAGPEDDVTGGSIGAVQLEIYSADS